MKDAEEECCVLCCSRWFLPSVLYNKRKTGQHVLLPYSPDYSQGMEVQFMEGDVSFAAAGGI